MKALRSMELGATTAALLVASLGGCHGVRPHVRTDDRYGFLVVGPIAALRFGFAEGDTLLEVPRSTAPAGVKDSAEVRARAFGCDHACTRYFTRNARYLVLLEADCTKEDVEDGEALAALDDQGRTIGSPIPQVTDEHIAALKPGRRAPQ